MTSTGRGAAAAWCVALALVASERGASQPPFPTGSQAEAILFGDPLTPTEPEFIPSPNNVLRVEHLMLAASFFTLLHELGHMIVSEYKVPVIGREENGVDRFATLMMTPGPKPAGSPPDTFDPATDPNSPPVIWAAWWWHEWWTRQQAEGQVADYAGRHGPNIARSVEVMCLVYGSDPERFVRPFRAFLPEESRDDCVEEAYANAASWGQVLALGDSSWKYRGRVAYNAAPPELVTARAWLMETQLLEAFAAKWLDELSVPPRAVPDIEFPALQQLDPYRVPIDVVADACLQPDGSLLVNASWDEQQRRIVLCYAYVVQLEAFSREAIARTEIGQREKMPE